MVTNSVVLLILVEQKVIQGHHKWPEKINFKHGCALQSCLLQFHHIHSLTHNLGRVGITPYQPQCIITSLDIFLAEPLFALCGLNAVCLYFIPCTLLSWQTRRHRPALVHPSMPVANANSSPMEKETQADN